MPGSIRIGKPPRLPGEPASDMLRESNTPKDFDCCATEAQPIMLPPEPPVGTVVAPADYAQTGDDRRWRHQDGYWAHTAGGTRRWRAYPLRWVAVLNSCPQGVVVVSEPVDSDGQAELDRLRVDVVRLTRAAERTKRDHDLILAWLSRLVGQLIGGWDPNGDLTAQCERAEQKIKRVNDALGELSEKVSAYQRARGEALRALSGRVVR